MKDQQTKKRMWKPEEDLILRRYVELHGEGNWSSVSKKLGLRRGGKSCRLRWKNYLRPDIKHGSMTKDEEDLIIRMHKLIGNRWSLIAGRLPGRTDNEVKNYWNTYLTKKAPKRRGKRKTVSRTVEENQAKTAILGQTQREEEEEEEDDVKEDIVINESKESEEKYWSSIHDLTGEMLVGPGSDAGILSCSMMDMDLMDNNNCDDPFMIFGGEFDEQELWDHGNCVLFDTFGSDWTLP